MIILEFAPGRPMEAIETPEARSFGPQCPCHGKRNMQRMGYSLYRCQESGDSFLFIVDAREECGYRMAPLPNVREAL